MRRSSDHERARRLLQRVLRIPLLVHFPLHSEARLQFDITEEAARAGFLVALGFLAGSKLCPFRSKLVARLRLFGRAPALFLLRAAFELALPRNIEFRMASAIGVGCREVRIMIGR